MRYPLLLPSACSPVSRSPVCRHRARAGARGRPAAHRQPGPRGTARHARPGRSRTACSSAPTASPSSRTSPRSPSSPAAAAATACWSCATARASFSDPVFISMTGGSFGWQWGVQSTDIVLVFTTEQGRRGHQRRQADPGRGRLGGGRSGGSQRLGGHRPRASRPRSTPTRAIAGSSPVSPWMARSSPSTTIGERGVLQEAQRVAPRTSSTAA